MLSNAYFYYQLTRKYVVVFGNLFNNIALIRKIRDTDTEIERMKIPIVYAPKEKYITRLFSDPDLNKATAITLPRMSFDINGISYDASRKQNSLLKVAKGDTATRVSSQYMGVPYDLNFELNIYTKTIDDGTHIVEQILPYFNPDYTVTIDSVPDLGFLKDIPIILNGITYNIEHEGNFDSVRYINWTLTFTMKAYYYGPITKPKIIRKVITNINNDLSLKAGNIIQVNTSNGNSGIFKTNDVVFQGSNYETATAFAKVINWNANTGTLVIGGSQGQFRVNTNIRAVSTNATYKLASFDVNPLKLAEIIIEPDPINADPDEDFGYTTTITEWPDIS